MRSMTAGKRQQRGRRHNLPHDVLHKGAPAAGFDKCVLCVTRFDCKRSSLVCSMGREHVRVTAGEESMSAGWCNLHRSKWLKPRSLSPVIPIFKCVASRSVNNAKQSSAARQQAQPGGCQRTEQGFLRTQRCTKHGASLHASAADRTPYHSKVRLPRTRARRASTHIHAPAPHTPLRRHRARRPLRRRSPRRLTGRLQACRPLCRSRARLPQATRPPLPLRPLAIRRPLRPYEAWLQPPPAPPRAAPARPPLCGRPGPAPRAARAPRAPPPQRSRPRRAARARPQRRPAQPPRRAAAAAAATAARARASALCAREPGRAGCAPAAQAPHAVSSRAALPSRRGCRPSCAASEPSGVA